MTALSEPRAVGPTKPAPAPDDPRDRDEPIAETPPAADATDADATAVDRPAEDSGRSLLSRLVPAHQAGVWRYLRYLGADATEADDLVQETFLSVARGGFTEQSERQTVAFLRKAARNQLLMLRRQQKRRVDTTDLNAAEAAWADAEAYGEHAWDDLLDALGGCVERLTGRQRQAVELHYREGAGRQAIADRLGMKPDGVKTLLRRTRQLLRECVERATGAEA